MLSEREVAIWLVGRVLSLHLIFIDVILLGAFLPLDFKQDLYTLKLQMLLGHAYTINSSYCKQEFSVNLPRWMAKFSPWICFRNHACISKDSHQQLKLIKKWNWQSLVRSGGFVFIFHVHLTQSSTLKSILVPCSFHSRYCFHVNS